MVSLPCEKQGNSDERPVRPPRGNAFLLRKHQPEVERRRVRRRRRRVRSAPLVGIKVTGPRVLRDLIISRGAPARIVDYTASFIFKRKRGKEAEYRHNGRTLEASARAPISISTLCDLINATRVPRDLQHAFSLATTRPRCLFYLYDQ